MCLFKLGFIKHFQKEESLAVSKMCNIIENPETKTISLRDFKILVLSICKLSYDWMFCTAPNIDQEKIIKKELGFFYLGKYYLSNKEECKAVN